jgi:uncharacterized protein YhbP (UPF0306 family)
MWIPYKSYEEKALYIINANNYAVIATSDKTAKPWGTVVFYAYDNAFNFYFISAIDSLHSANIAENPYVTMVIFDSMQPIGSYDEVQIYGKASTMPKNAIGKALKIYTKRLFSKSKGLVTDEYDPMEYDAPSEFRIFKVVPDKIFTTTGYRRTEVDLKQG